MVSLLRTSKILVGNQITLFAILAKIRYNIYLENRYLTNSEVTNLASERGLNGIRISPTKCKKTHENCETDDDGL